MQSNGPLAASSQEFNIAVYPKTRAVPQNIWHLVRQQITKFCFLLIALVISGITASASQGTLSFSPASASLGSVPIETSRTTMVTIKNTGTASVRISAEAVQASEFSVSGLTIPLTIAPGGSVAFTIKFSPTSTGFFAGYIAISSNATNSSVLYSVSGTGVTPGTLTATPSSVSFGSVAVGSKNSQTVQLKNTGGSALTLSSDSLLGTGFTLNGLASSPSLTLEAGQTTSFAVGFAPTMTGSVTGSLTLRSTATNSTLMLALSGTGVSDTRTISLSAASLNFGNEIVGGTSTLDVAVKNAGNSSVTVSTISVNGTGFSVGSGVAGTTIAAGQTAELKVIFAPMATGSVNGKVAITSNASNSPNSVSLAGTGVSSTAHSVTLNWTASSSSGVIGYYVYRSITSGSSYTQLTSSAVNALTYTDGSVSAGETYYYLVTAVNSSGAQSSYSGQAIAIIP